MSLRANAFLTVCFCPQTFKHSTLDSVPYSEDEKAPFPQHPNHRIGSNEKIS